MFKHIIKRKNICWKWVFRAVYIPEFVGKVPYYNGPFGCTCLDVSVLDLKVTFPISANFGIETLFLNFNKTFDLRSLYNRFLFVSACCPHV